jgi:hypothetical protein
MTSQSPRIYLYKITFEEVPYYYYGVHKEKKFNEYYMGSPVTHKWVWDFYTPKKQILQFFDFTDEGWLEALEVEKRLIKPFYNIDKWCLNEHCGGGFSLKVRINAGKIGGRKAYRNKLGIHALTSEEKSEVGKMSYYSGNHFVGSMSKEEKSNHSKKIYEKGLGIGGLSKQKRIDIGNKTYEMNVGIHSIPEEEHLKNCSIGGSKAYELGLGIHSQTKKQKSEYGRMGAKILNSQRWECCETGFISTPGNVVKYQKARGIDTSKSNRRRIS